MIFDNVWEFDDYGYGDVVFLVGYYFVNGVYKVDFIVGVGFGVVWVYCYVVVGVDFEEWCVLFVYFVEVG